MRWLLELLQDWPLLLLLACFAAWRLERRASSVFGGEQGLVGVEGLLAADIGKALAEPGSKPAPDSCIGFATPGSCIPGFAEVDNGMRPGLEVAPATPAGNEEAVLIEVWGSAMAPVACKLG
jgi:hypothetical protein